MTVRTPIRDFELANPIYKNASVSFYTVSSGVKTTTLATLYAGPSAAAQLANPQKLNSQGQFKQPVYIASEVIGTITGISVASHDTAIHSPSPDFRVQQSTAKLQYSYDGVTWNDTGDTIFNNRGVWVTATAYKRNDLSTNGALVYLSLVAHTSGTFATDLAAGDWLLILDLTAFIREVGISVTEFGASATATAATNVTAFGLAIAAAIAQRKTLIIPEVGDYYDFDSEINIPATADLLTIQWDGRLRFTGTSGIAVSLGTYNTARLDFLTICGRGLWLEAQTTVWANGVTGVDIYGCFDATMNIRRVTGFESGLRFRGDGTYATEYSQFFLDQVLDNKYDINFAGIADSQNNFFGGRVGVSLSSHSGESTDSCGIYIADNNNNNTFYGTSIESSATGRKDYKVYCGGDYNAFINCRWEGAATKTVVMLTATSNYNDFYYGYGAPNPRGDDSAVDLGNRNNFLLANYEVKDGEATYRPGSGALTAPTIGNWQRNDRAFISAATRSYPTAWVCINDGTFGTLNGGATTGTISINTATLVVNSTAGLARNQWLTLVGIATIAKVIDIVGTTVTLDRTVNASVAGAAVSFKTPVFVATAPAWDFLPAAYTGGEGYVTWNPGNIVAGAGETSPDITITGLDQNYAIVVRPPYDLQGLTCTGYYQSAGKAKIQLNNSTAGAVDLANSTWYVRAIRMFE